MSTHLSSSGCFPASEEGSAGPPLSLATQRPSCSETEAPHVLQCLASLHVRLDQVQDWPPRHAQSISHTETRSSFPASLPSLPPSSPPTLSP